MKLFKAFPIYKYGRIGNYNEETNSHDINTEEEEVPTNYFTYHYL